jgi:hypothetical protein
MRLMNDNNIALLTQLIESSPAVVLVCFFFIGLLLRWHHRMEMRLQDKDEQIIALQRDTLQALYKVQDAVRDLANALRSAR